MKIKVHEIEGDYYCAIDDITVAVSKATRKPRSRERCLADLIQEYNVFLDYKSSKGTVLVLDGERHYRELRNGFYKILCWHYPCTNQTWAHDDNPKPQIEIVRVSPTKDGRTYTEPSLPMYPTTSDYFIMAVDAKIYLADVATDDDFVMPNSEPTTPKAEPIAEQPTTEIKSPYLNEQSEYFPPYLAIAVDIWERAYIHGEIAEIEKEKPSITKDKREPIKNLIERHYPNLKPSWVTSIASIITTFQGKSIEGVNSE